jgi:hypothetical protein
VRRSSLAWSIPAGAVVAALTWHVPWVVPQPGVDNSWAIALNVAASRGLDFGRDLVFTYGPLGFLSVPLAAIGGATGPLGLAYATLVQVALAAVAVAAGTRVYGRIGGVVAAFVAVGLTILVSDVLALLALFATVWILERDDAPVEKVWLVPLAGLVAAFELLVKLNGGVLCLALFALAAWRVAPRGWRSELVLAASFVVSVLVLWVATRNSLSALPAWLRESRHIVGSYTDAMALELRGRTTETVVAGVLVAAGALLLFLHVRELPRRRAITLSVAAAVFTYAYLKEGFVRHDEHVLEFFGAFAVAALAFAWRGPLRWGAAALVVGAALGAATTPDVTLASLYAPRASVLALAHDVRDMASPKPAAWRADAQNQLRVPVKQLRLLAGHTVDSVPYEVSAVWAYRLRWQQEPLLQWYMAYDDQLDRFNARAIERRGAERVLEQMSGGSDAELLAFQAPATYLALLCNYRELSSDASWEVLARTTNRCGTERPLAAATFAAGETVTVPSAGADDLVVAHVDAHRSLLSKLQSVVLKPFTLPTITIGGLTHRLVTAAATGPLVMRAPAAVGRSPFFGGFTTYPTFTLSLPARVSFDAIRIRPEPFHVVPQTPPEGSLAARSLTVQGHRYRIEPGAFTGWVDTARAVRRVAALSGWAVDAQRHAPAPVIAAFDGARLVGVVAPTEARPDVARGLGQAALQSGYMLFVRAPQHTRLRVFAFGNGLATELNYPPEYPWAGR